MGVVSTLADEKCIQLTLQDPWQLKVPDQPKFPLALLANEFQSLWDQLGCITLLCFPVDRYLPILPIFSRLTSLVLGQSWRRHQMETFSALLAICVGNSPVPGEFPTQMPVTWSFDVFFDLRLNKRFSKQPWGWWFETLSRPLWRHRNDCPSENFQGLPFGLFEFEDL